MREFLITATAALAVLLPLHAQDRASSPVLRIEVNLHEGNDPAAKTGRRYTLQVEDSHRGTFHAGARIPVATGSSQAGSQNLVNTQWTYVDAGVNIDCTAHESAGKVTFHGNLDLSSMVKSDPSVGNAPGPTITQTKVELDTTLDLGKPTVIASIDDPATSHRLQVEVTVTRVN